MSERLPEIKFCQELHKIYFDSLIFLQKFLSWLGEGKAKCRYWRAVKPIRKGSVLKPDSPKADQFEGESTIY
jgi:hypothetical protein